MLQFASQDALGTVTRSRSTKNIHCKLVRFEPGLRFPIHTHECPGFYFLLSGQNRDLAYDGTSIDQEPGARCFFNRDTPHARHIGPEGLLTCNVSYEAAWLESLGLETVADQANFWRPNGASSAAWPFINFALGWGSDLESEAVALELLACFSSQQETKAPKWLGKARDYLDSHYRRPLNMKALALEVGIDAAHLSSTFRRFYGCTPTSYIQNLRIDHVLARISTGERSLGDLALEAGFSDQAHFSRVFRQHAGMSASHFKKVFDL